MMYRCSSTQHWLAVFVNLGHVIVAAANYKLKECSITTSVFGYIFYAIRQKTLDFFGSKDVQEIL
ncbi:unnamed protein product, partial [Trichogramma brassicae]